MLALTKLIIHKLTLLKLTVSVFLLILVSGTALAQQDEKTTSAQKTPQTDVASKSDGETKSNAIAIPSPISLTQQHKADLKHYLPPDKVTPLLAGPDDYITLITEYSSINNKGVAILLPDWQQGATSPKGINFLRNTLPQQGWTTMSIQPSSKPEGYPSKALKMSELRQENKIIIDAYKIKFNAMINAVIDKSKEYPGMVIVIAQGHHGALLVDLLAQQSSNQASTMVNAVILLSSYVLTSDELSEQGNTHFAKTLAYSEYPVLDLYLRHDNPIVLDKTKQRLALSKQEMKVYYRQRQLNNTAMGYYPEQELLTQINSWLKSIGW